MAWLRLKTFPGGGEVHSGFDQRLFCLRYAEHVCSLWVVFGAGDVLGRTTPCPPEVKVERDTLVWNWISVARLEWALNYLPVRNFVSGWLLQSAYHCIMIIASLIEAVQIPTSS